MGTLLQIRAKLFELEFAFLSGVNTLPWARREPTSPVPQGEGNRLPHHGHRTIMRVFPVPDWVPQHGCTPARAQLKRQMEMLVLPHVEESLLPLTSSLLQEILYMRLHQRIKIDAF